MKKYDKIRHLGHEKTDGIFSDGAVRILEKIDGANFRWQYHEKSGGLLCGSRNFVFWEPDESGEGKIPQGNEQFRHVIEYLYNEIDFNRLKTYHRKYGDLVFFGEAMYKHSLDYDAWEGKHPDIGGDVPNYLGFDIWDPGEGEFLRFDAVRGIHEDLGLQTVPDLGVKWCDEIEKEDLEIPESDFREPEPDADTEFDRKGLAEGIVIRNDDLGIRAKRVHEVFKEKNAIAFEDPGKAQTTAGKWVAGYVTKARIRKQIHKLVDEGDYAGPEMEMMEELPQAVLEDVMAEEGWEIICSNRDLTKETKDEIRSKTSRKCVRVLKNVINKRGLEAVQ